LRRELPRRSRQPLVPRNEERFDQQRAPSFEVRFEGPTDFPRVVFESANRVELIQLQPHRLTLNWRQPQADADYPHYTALRKRFRSRLKVLFDALDELGQPHPVELSEVTYVNPIDCPGDSAADDVGRTHPDPANIINRFKHRPSNAFLPEAEDVHLQARWRIPNAGGQPIGRLHLSVEPGLRPPQPADLRRGAGEHAPEPTPIYLVNLTARVMPGGATVDKAMKALDVGHKWVVLGFTDLTTTKMHRIWGLRK
jgi:uncharacterized protein (TIGR04255 family)